MARREKQTDMTAGSPFQIILNFTIPIFIGNVFQQFYNMADTIIVGKFVGTGALAAVGSGDYCFPDHRFPPGTDSRLFCADGPALRGRRYEKYAEICGNSLCFVGDYNCGDDSRQYAGHEESAAVYEYSGGYF